MPLECDFTDYRPSGGLRAEAVDGDLLLEWVGAPPRGVATPAPGMSLRATLGLDGGEPVIRQMAALSRAGHWAPLVRDARPDFHVVEGVRRISNQQINPMRDLGREATPELVEAEKWKVFWDAPLVLPGLAGVNPGLPRDPGEIMRSDVEYDINACNVRRVGARLEVSFESLRLGSFEGLLRFTVYPGSSLVRQEVIAATFKPSVAYVYRAGLSGLRSDDYQRMRWRDVARDWQQYRFGGGANDGPVPLRARNRVLLLEQERGVLAVFPPSHKFFFAREIEMNLGYVWYRQGGDGRFAVGVRQAEREGMYRPWGASDEIWEKRARQSRRFAQGNFALFNAPPGTRQRMAVYYYLGSEGAQSTLDSVLEFTNGDKFRPLDGYQVAVSHFHTHFAEQLIDTGSLDARPPWVSALRGLGINIAMMSDFHGDGHPNDAGDLRFRELGEYFEACRRHSDEGFLLMPGEEPNVHLGGHYTLVFPKPVYWSKVRAADAAFRGSHPSYGRVFRVGSAEEMLAMVESERGLLWQAHPRTKGSTSWRSLAGADLRGAMPWNSRRHEQLGRAQVHDRRGQYLYQVPGGRDLPAPHRQLRAAGLCAALRRRLESDHGGDAEGRFLRGDGRGPHPFVSGRRSRGAQDAGSGSGMDVPPGIRRDREIVWGDGNSTGRQILPTPELGTFGSKTFRMDFNATGRKWVRFAAWDSAGNGAFTQPVHFDAAAVGR